MKITALTPDDLIRKIYAKEGWPRVEGENRVARCKALYEINTDWRKGRYVATRRH